MRRLLSYTVISLLAGFGLLAGLYLAQYAYDTLFAGKAHAYIDHPAGFEFRNYQKLENTKTFTIEGELLNTTDVAWERVLLQVDIYAGSAYMTYCRTGIDHLDKYSSRSFRLECRVTSGSNLPDNISYQLLVAKAAKE